MFRNRMRVVLLAAMSLAGASLMFGAGGEVSGMGGGANFGGSHGIFGGGGGIRLGERGLVFGEYNYMSLGGASAGTIKASASIQNFGAGYDYSFRDAGSSKMIPFVDAALGIGHGAASVSVAGSKTSAGTNGAYFGFGGGLRYFVGKNWGLKPQLRFQRYSGGNATLYTIGVFYSFGK